MQTPKDKYEFDFGGSTLTVALDPVMTIIRKRADQEAWNVWRGHLYIGHIDRRSSSGVHELRREACRCAFSIKH